MRETEGLYSLGLEERDTLNIKLGGGIPRSSLALIEGEYGAGKSAFAQRFTFGFCECGHSVAYVTAELDLDGFLKQMNSLNYNVVDHILGLRLLFLGVSMESGRNYIQRLMEAERMWQGDITIIDSFDQLVRNDERFEKLKMENDEEQIAHELISHFRDIIHTGRSIVLLEDPTNLSEEVLSPFKSVADIYFKLEMHDVGGQTRRLLSVKRFAGMGKQVGDSVGYTVRSHTGIVMEARGVV